MSKLDSDSLTRASSEAVVAAIDVGSNSFHLLVGRVIQGEIKVISKLSEKVMLAEGLNEKNKLSEQSIQRGLACLQRFAQRLKSSDVESVRAVATNALRVCLLYTSPSPRDRTRSRMPSSA